MVHLQLVTLTGTKFDDDVYEVILPTLDGEIGVLQDHMPLISVATIGVVTVRRQPRDPDSAREFFAISGGVIQVEDNKLRVIVDEADHADSINEAEAEKARAAAEQMVANAKDQLEIDRAQEMVDRQAVRLQVANLRRRHQKH